MSYIEKLPLQYQFTSIVGKLAVTCVINVISNNISEPESGDIRHETYDELTFLFVTISAHLLFSAELNAVCMCSLAHG